MGYSPWGHEELDRIEMTEHEHEFSIHGMGWEWLVPGPLLATRMGNANVPHIK